MRISVACVGTKKDELTLEVARAAREADRVILHTERCGFAEWLKENGVSYESLDALYETAEDFDEHAKLAAEAVMKVQGEHVLYAVLDEADQSVKALFRAGARVNVIGAGAFGELLARAVKAPVIMLLVPMLIPLIPGGDLYYMMSFLVRGQYEAKVRAGVPLRPEWTENYPDADGFFRVYVNGVFAGMGEKTETGEIRFRAMLLPPINETLPK